MISKNEIASAAWKGMIWRFLERCSSQIVLFIVSIVLARLLLPEQYGLIAMTMIFITISEVFVTSGLGSALVQQSEYNEKAFSTMFWASVLFSLTVYGVIFIVAPYISILMHNQDLTIVLRVLGLRLPISAMNSIQQAYVSQQMIFRKFFFSTLSGAVASGFIGIIMAYTGFGVWALVGQNLSMTIVNTLTLHSIIPWRPTRFFSRNIFQRLYGYSWRVMLANVMGTFFDQLRGFLIGHYYTSSDLAYVNRGELFPKALAGNISSTMQNVLFPVFSHIKEDKVLLREALRKAMTIGGFVVAGLMAVMAGTASSLVDVILTGKWAPVVPYLQCCCLLECFGVLGSTNSLTIKALGKADIVLNLEFIKKPIYFLFIMIGVMISPLAIVMGNTLYNLVGFMINAWPNRKLLDYSLISQFKDTIVPIVLGFIMFVLLQHLDTMLPHKLGYLLLEGIIGLLVYFIVGKMLHFLGAEFAYQFLMKKIRKN